MEVVSDFFFVMWSRVHRSQYWDDTHNLVIKVADTGIQGHIDRCRQFVIPLRVSGIYTANESRYDVGNLGLPMTCHSST